MAGETANLSGSSIMSREFDKSLTQRQQYVNIDTQSNILIFHIFRPGIASQISLLPLLASSSAH